MLAAHVRADHPPPGASRLPRRVSPPRSLDVSQHLLTWSSLRALSTPPGPLPRRVGQPGRPSLVSTLARRARRAARGLRGARGGPRPRDLAGAQRDLVAGDPHERPEVRAQPVELAEPESIPGSGAQAVPLVEE